MKSESRQVVVVGGGITGLACAHRLRRSGADVLLIESSEEVGGVVQTVMKEGYEFEEGPNTLLATSKPLWEMIGELGLGEDVIDASAAAKKRYILMNGRLVPVPSNPIAALGSPLLGPMGLMGALGDLFKGRGKDVAADENVASFIERRFGRRVLENLVSPFLSGVYAGDAEKLEARSILKSLVEAEECKGSVIRGMIAQRRASRKPGEPKRRLRSITFKGGLVRLTRRLGEALGDGLRAGSPVASIEVEGDGCRVKFENGGDVMCRRVVVATDAGSAAALVGSLPGGAAIAQDLASIRRASVAVVGLVTSRDAVEHPLDGFGFLRGPDGPRPRESPLLGCLFRSTIFPHTVPTGKVLLTCFVGGSKHDISKLSDEAIRDITKREVSELLGIKGAATVMFYRRWTKTIPQMERGHHLRAKRIVEWSNRGPVSIASSAVHGVSLPVCVATGRAEADRLLSCLSTMEARSKEARDCAPA